MGFLKETGAYSVAYYDWLICMVNELGVNFVKGWIGFTQRPQSSSFSGLPYRILNMNRQKELLRGLWVGFT